MGLPWTPERFWENIQAKYGQSSNPFSRFLASTIGAGSSSTPRNGVDSGNPRYGINTFDWLMSMLKAPLKPALLLMARKDPTRRAIEDSERRGSIIYAQDISVSNVDENPRRCCRSPGVFWSLLRNGDDACGSGVSRRALPELGQGCIRGCANGFEPRFAHTCGLVLESGWWACYLGYLCPEGFPRGGWFGRAFLDWSDCDRSFTGADSLACRSNTNYIGLAIPGRRAYAILH